MSSKKSEFYDQLWKNEWKNITTMGPGIKTRYRIILKLFKKYNLQGKIMDIGCGDGTLLSLLPQSNANKLFGFDISPEAIEQTKKKKYISKLFLGDLTKKETLPQEKFDVVICSEVLEHIKDCSRAIRNISQMVKKGGVLLISVPHSRKYWTRHDSFSGHYKRFEKLEMEGELKKNEFEIIESLTWGFPIYAIYYFFLKRIPPSKAVIEDDSVLKKFGSIILYSLFRIDDLFRSKRARKLFVVARKSA